MSLFVRRIQPDETLVPMVQGSLVPWMRYSVSLLPLQRYMARRQADYRDRPSCRCRFATAPCAGAARACAPAFRGRIPIGPFLLATHCRAPGPDKAFRADAHAIANGLSGVVDDVKKMTTRIDDDRSRPLVCRVSQPLDLPGLEPLPPGTSNEIAVGPSDEARRIAGNVASCPNLAYERNGP